MTADQFFNKYYLLILFVACCAGGCIGWLLGCLFDVR